MVQNSRAYRTRKGGVILYKIKDKLKNIKVKIKNVFK